MNLGTSSMRRISWLRTYKLHTDSVLWNRHYYYYYYYYYHYHHHHHHHRHCFYKKNNIFDITCNLSQPHILCCCTHSTVQATASTRAAEFRVVSLRARYVGTVNQTCRARLGRSPLPYTGESSPALLHGVTSNIFWGHIPAVLSSSSCCMNILHSTSEAFCLVSEKNFQLRSLQTPLGTHLSVFHSALTCISKKHMKVILAPPLLQSDVLQNFTCTNSLSQAWPSGTCKLH